MRFEHGIASKFRKGELLENWLAPLREPLEQMILGTSPEATLYQNEIFEKILDS